MAKYHPYGVIEGDSPDTVDYLNIFDYDLSKLAVTSAKMTLRQWVLGAAFCVSFWFRDEKSLKITLFVLNQEKSSTFAAVFIDNYDNVIWLRLTLRESYGRK